MCLIGVLRVITKLSLSLWRLNQLRNIIGSKILLIKPGYTMRLGPTGKKEKKKIVLTFLSKSRPQELHTD